MTFNEYSFENVFVPQKVYDAAPTTVARIYKYFPDNNDDSDDDWSLTCRLPVSHMECHSHCL